MAATVDVFGGLDILVNNAGLGLGGAIEDIPFDTYERMIAVNVTGVFVATQEAVRHMKAGGRVIHIGSSMVRYAAFPTASLYTLTKGAIAGFNRSLVRDLGPKGITVNTVHPGPTDTDMNPAGGPVSEIVGPGIALGRYGQPHEIAGVVAFLAGPDVSSTQTTQLRPRCFAPRTCMAALRAQCLQTSCPARVLSRRSITCNPRWCLAIRKQKVAAACCFYRVTMRTPKPRWPR
ncbi:3-oxoacyl-[acyl-carrier-protein] reductase [compost metagenome]